MLGFNVFADYQHLVRGSNEISLVDKPLNCRLSTLSRYTAMTEFRTAVSFEHINQFRFCF